MEVKGFQCCWVPDVIYNLLCCVSAEVERHTGLEPHEGKCKNFHFVWSILKMNR